MQVWQPLIGVLLALLVAVLAVRALGETDLNPVSGVGKLSQVLPMCWLLTHNKPMPVVPAHRATCR